MGKREGVKGAAKEEKEGKPHSPPVLYIVLARIANGIYPLTRDHSPACVGFYTTRGVVLPTRAGKEDTYVVQ